jgi:hypothetical protein
MHKNKSFLNSVGVYPDEHSIHLLRLQPPLQAYRLTEQTWLFMWARITESCHFSPLGDRQRVFIASRFAMCPSLPYSGSIHISLLSLRHQHCVCWSVKVPDRAAHSDAFWLSRSAQKKVLSFMRPEPSHREQDRAILKALTSLLWFNEHTKPTAATGESNTMKAMRDSKHSQENGNHCLWDCVWRRAALVMIMRKPRICDEKYWEFGTVHETFAGYDVLTLQ